MKYMKHVTLTLLTVQNAAHIMMMRYCRTRTDDLFFTSSLIVITELVKLFISIIVFSYTIGLKSLYNETFSDIVDSIKVVIPAIIYVVQNNLLYVALENLDAATFQITYQLKLLTTAIFSVFMLRKKISVMQWLSLFILFIGVAIVQIEPNANKVNENVDVPQNRFLGVTAVLVACFLSGFAGIYFEMILKGSKQSLWARNILLAFIGIVCSLLGQLITEREIVKQKGFFFGFDYLVVILIILQSAGGLLVAMVVKYASQVLKGFACSASIVISIIFSVFLFGNQISLMFLIGSSLVIVSIVLYANASSPSSATQKDIEKKKSN